MMGTAQPYIPEKLGFVIHDSDGPTIVTYCIGADGISPTVGLTHLAKGLYGLYKDFSAHLSTPKYDATIIIRFYEELLAAERNATLSLDTLVEKAETHFGNPNLTQQQPPQ